MERIVCIGAGPAGLTAAYELAKNGLSVTVLEADRKYVGGLARTVGEDGFRFDIGGHRFFSKSDEVVALWKEILGPNLLKRPRKSRIYYGGKFYPYPLRLEKTLANLGLVESALCALSYGYARLFPHPRPETFEQWVTNKFGARLFKIFFKTYTEKVWGMSCSQISADWAAQRIKGLSLMAAVKNAALGAMGVSNNGRQIKTLIEEFLYPRQGPGMMWEKAAEKIRANGGIVELGCEVKTLAYVPDRKLWHISYEDKKTGRMAIMEAKHVISSMPLQTLAYAVAGAPEHIRQAASGLHYRDFLIVALVLKDRRLFDDNWLYIHDPGVRAGRIQNFKAWSPDMVPDPEFACYGMEYFCFENDGLWNSSDEELIALATGELAAIGLAAPQDILKGYVVRQLKAYPVYDRHYERQVALIREWLEQDCPELQVAGRNGMHKYNNQDHSMMTALLAARNIITGHKRYDVWSVNQDAEYHEFVAPVAKSRKGA